MWGVTPSQLHDMQQASPSTVGMVMLSLEIYIFLSLIILVQTLQMNPNKDVTTSPLFFLISRKTCILRAIDTTSKSIF